MVNDLNKNSRGQIVHWLKAFNIEGMQQTVFKIKLPLKIRKTSSQMNALKKRSNYKFLKV